MEAIQNKKAHFDYEVLEKFEAGMVLSGAETKSIRLGRMNLAGSFVVLRGEEVFLLNAAVFPYQPQNTPRDYEPTRPKKLLLHKKEIQYLLGKSRQKGLTLIPLRVYSNKGKIKTEFALARGRKQSQKKERIQKRELDRDIRRELLAKRG
jgi:SsrA-binding protein